MVPHYPRHDANRYDRTTALLEAAHKQGGSQLKRFVYSGSSAAVASYFQPIEKARKPWTEADWNDVCLPYSYSASPSQR
jgi:nucleoside-diphosphate-sugar epimerase